MTSPGRQAFLSALGAHVAARAGTRAGHVAALVSSPRRRSRRTLAAALAGWARDRVRRQWLADRLRRAVLALASGGRAPGRGARAEAWALAIDIAARLHVAGAWRLPASRVLPPDQLVRLSREAARCRPARVETHTRYAAPGPALRQLAVSAALADAVTEAVGRAVRPAFTAVYMYDPPGIRVPPHLDTADFEIVVHLVLEHQRPRRARGSALVLYGDDRSRRLGLAVGAAVALGGRGQVHRWEPLGPAESRTMAAIGFTPR